MAVTKEPDMKGFLTQYFMQRVFNAMSDEQFAQYQDIIKNKDFIGNMKDWKETWHLVKEVDGKWVMNDLPAPTDFNVDIADANADDAWEKLYKELRNAFRQIANGRDRLDPKADKYTLQFLDAFYGFGQLFTPAELTGNAKDQLDNEFLPFLKSNKTNLYQALKDLGIYTDTEKKFSDFISDLGKGKHNTDNNVHDTLSHIVGYLRSSYYAPAIEERMGTDRNNNPIKIPNLDVLADGLENDDVDAAKLKEFKENYQLILNPIEKEKNIYQNFSPYLKTVKTAIETAKKRVDYNNAESKDFLKEKRPDKKGPVEQLISDVKDSWADHTDKYFSLHKSRLFYSDQAQAIVKAIDKAKFKPTEGLDKFVENLKKIGDNVKGNIAKQHFKWFSETITKLHGDKQMSSIFASALKKPHKLKELATEIAIQGIKDGKKDEEIETAMEVLKTIQYGYATSNHLNAVLKQDLSLFSDKSLSWNKQHEGMYVVMKGVDQTINFAIKGTAFIATVGYNIINRNIGNKFGGKVPKRAVASFATYQKQFDAQKADKEAEKTLLDKLDNANLTNAKNEITATGITADTLDAENQRLETLRTDEATKKATYESYVPYKDAVDNAKKTVDDKQRVFYEKLENYEKYKQEVDQLQQVINDHVSGATPLDAATYATVTRMLLKATNNMNTAEASRNAATGEFTNAENDLNAAQGAFATVQHNYDAAKAEYDVASSATTDLETKIEKFKSATQQIKDANNRIKKREEDFNKWIHDNQDRFAKLMLHWDFLNSGRKRTGENVIQQALEGILPLSQKARQKRYNERKDEQHEKFLKRYLDQYSMAA